MTEPEVAWNLFTELRKEVLESQKIRAQIIGVKITFVSAGVGLIAGNPDKIPGVLLVIPAFAAVFFDLLVMSYTYSIKRIGHYCRVHLEKRIHAACKLPADFFLWQEFLQLPQTKQTYSRVSNCGLTFLAIAPALISLFTPFRPLVSVPLTLALLAAFAFDLKVSYAELKFPVPTETNKSPEPTTMAVTPHAIE